MACQFHDNVRRRKGVSGGIGQACNRRCMLLECWTALLLFGCPCLFRQVVTGVRASQGYTSTECNVSTCACCTAGHIRYSRADTQTGLTNFNAPPQTQTRAHAPPHTPRRGQGFQTSGKGGQSTSNERRSLTAMSIMVGRSRGLQCTKASEKHTRRASSQFLG